MKVGDLITTYYKGYFRLTRIERRFITDEHLRYMVYQHLNEGDEIAPLYYFVQEYDSYGNPRKSKKEQSCDATHCSLAKDIVEKQVNNFSKILQKILAQN